MSSAKGYSVHVAAISATTLSTFRLRRRTLRLNLLHRRHRLLRHHHRKIQTIQITGKIAQKAEHKTHEVEAIRGTQAGEAIYLVVEGVEEMRKLYNNS